MHSFHLHRSFALAAWALLLASCATTPMSRIDAHRAVYESWPVEVQDAVHSGRVIPGMTPEMVEMALGKPTEVTSRSGKDGLEEIWSYKKTSAKLPGLLQNTRVSVGGNIGGVGVGTGTSGRRGGQSPEDADDQEIVFKNGVVSRGSP